LAHKDDDIICGLAKLSRGQNSIVLYDYLTDYVLTTALLSCEIAALGLTGALPPKPQPRMDPKFRCTVGQFIG